MMLCQNHTSPVSRLDGAGHSCGLESARVLPPIKLVFLTLSVITDKTKSAPTCVIQTSCKSTLPCLYGRRMFPSGRKEGRLLRSQLLNYVGFMAHFCVGWVRGEGKAIPMVLRCEKAHWISPPIPQGVQSAKNQEKTQRLKIFIWKRKPAARSCGIKGQLLCGDKSAVACVL